MAETDNLLWQPLKDKPMKTKRIHRLEDLAGFPIIGKLMVSNQTFHRTNFKTPNQMCHWFVIFVAGKQLMYQIKQNYPNVCIQKTKERGLCSLQ